MYRLEINNFKMTAGEYEGLYCKVPCSLYSVLLDNRLIESPYYRENFKYMAKTVPGWAKFSSVVHLLKSVAESKYVYLRVRGIYGNAEILFNGKSCGMITSADKEQYIDVTDKVSEGENTVLINLSAPQAAVRELRESAAGGIELAPGAPSLFDLGIADSLELISTNNALIEWVDIAQVHNGSGVTLELSISILGQAEDMRAVITLTSPVGKIYFGAIVGGFGTVTVPDPQLWWPKGLGEPSLYKLEITLYCGDEAEDCWQSLIGLREVSFEKDGSAISVNGRAFVPFGMTYSPQDLILPCASYEKTESLVKAMADANANTLMLTPSNALPAESLYALCDKYGIFILAGIALPYEKKTVGAEFTAFCSEYVLNFLRKAANHPSVIICGIVAAGKEGEELPASKDSLMEFLSSVQRVARAVIGNRAWANLEIIEACGGACKKIPALPCIKTVNEFTTGADRNLMSSVMEAHTEHPSVICDMLLALVGEYRLPNGFADLAYASALASADEFSAAVATLRMQRRSKTPDEFAALNDSWPALSTSAIDYYGRPKALYYAARRMFAPVIAAVAVSGSSVRFGISNESSGAFCGRLTYALYNAFDKCIKEFSLSVEAQAATAEWLAEEDFSKYMNEDLSEYYVVYELFDSVGAIGRGTRRFVPSKHFRFSDPQIRAKITGGGRNFEITLAAEAYAASVELDFSDVDADFADNYFDILEGVPVRIPVTTKEIISPEKLERMLIVKSVHDIGREAPEQLSF